MRLPTLFGTSVPGRYKGQFKVTYLNALARVDGTGESLTYDELVVLFASVPPSKPLHVQYEVNGKKLSGTVEVLKTEAVTHGGRAMFRCTARFVRRRPKEDEELKAVLESAPARAPRHAIKATAAPSPVFKRRHRPSASIPIPGSLEEPFIDLLVRERRMHRPKPGHRPLMAIKEKTRVEVASGGAMKYRVRTRMETAEGRHRTFDTELLVLDSGDVRLFDALGDDQASS